ncbi:MAG TPA: glycosyltransferase family 39 protein [Terrimicrobiaceae bacterium]|nr:glycosyltransferase family 39 protein [Terrimicrobiaceae bacterium]
MPQTRLQAGLDAGRVFVRSLPARILRWDRVLVLSVVIGALAGVQGLTWGGYDCLNLDRMAFMSLTSKSRGYLEPSTFDKPPFYGYLVHFGVVSPGNSLARKASRLGFDKTVVEGVRLRGQVIAVRLVHVAMFAACVVFVFLYARRFFGLAAARASAVLLATAAGFVPYQVFLTTDLPLVFWMLAALMACAWIMRSPTMGPSVLAGVLTGFAAATKYNGLAIGLGIPVAHLLAASPRPLLDTLKRPAAYAGVLAVPIAFIAANPYCVIKSQKFLADFMFNYRVTPVYSGQTGLGYGRFFGAFAEIFGSPLAWLLPAIVALGAWGMIANRRDPMWRGFALVAACFLLYAWKIGSFPRIETRFVLPAAPLLLLMAAPGFAWLAERSRWLAAGLVVPLAAYGAACSWYTASRFPNDPRMAALAWAEEHFPPKASVETTGSCPSWKKMPERKLQVTRMPFNVGQVALFDKIFANDRWVQDRVDQDRAQKDAGWFTAEALKARNPDFITVSSIDQEETTKEFYRQLIEGELGYRVVFAGETEPLPVWVYPQRTEFLINRITILERASAVPPEPASTP